LHQRAETLNSLTLKSETHNVVKCLRANYSDQIRVVPKLLKCDW